MTAKIETIEGGDGAQGEGVVGHRGATITMVDEEGREDPRVETGDQEGGDEKECQLAWWVVLHLIQ